MLGLFSVLLLDYAISSLSIYKVKFIATQKLSSLETQESTAACFANIDDKNSSVK